MAGNIHLKVNTMSEGNYIIYIVKTNKLTLLTYYKRSAVLQMMTTTSLLKSVGPMPLMNTQYLSTATLVKPVVVVSTPSTLPPHSNSSS